jgi:hypothetical protein
MHFNDFYKNVKIVCINLKERKDKKLYMKKQFKKQNILDHNYQFYSAKLHSNPKRGCLESHCNIIENATSCDILFVLEDDAKWLRPMNSTLPSPPPDWDMLYFGGTVRNNLGAFNKDWTRVRTWTTHAYMINMKNKELVKDILEARNYEMEIDNYYIEKIHNKYKCYMITPMMIVQKEGYSDIEKSNVNYDFMEKSLFGFMKPQHEIDDNGNYILKLSEISDENLPKISIITPTYNRRNIFPLPIKNFLETNYPKDKMEWIIVEDNDKNVSNVKDLISSLSNIYNIKYISVERDNYPITIAEKRNIGVENASGEIILHMDDDDYYFPEHAIARVKLLLKYTDKEIIGSSKLGAYNIITENSSFISDGELSLSEASMGYWKKTWEKQKFDNNQKLGEFRSFIQNRFDKIIDIPYTFVMIAINHKNNITNKRDMGNIIDKATGKRISYWDLLDNYTKRVLMNIK